VRVCCESDVGEWADRRRRRILRSEGVRAAAVLIHADAGAFHWHRNGGPITAIVGRQEERWHWRHQLHPLAAANGGSASGTPSGLQDAPYV